jgi:uncharacterized protein
VTTNISIMKKDTILKQLSLLKKTLTSQYGVSKIGLFGSVIRGENNKNSDIDILIDFEDGKETYQNFMSVCDTLEGFFHKHKLDIVTLKGLSPFIGKQILNEVEYV